MSSDIVIVGAGFAGAVIAEQLANVGFRVLIIEQRAHIGGNAYDEKDDNNLLIHKYGPHIFHTQSKRIYDYLSKFTEWRHYEHRVRACIDGKLYPIPINLDTLNSLYGLQLNEDDASAFLDRVRLRINHPKNSEEVVLASVGQDLYEKFFLNYTLKQWNLHPSQLAASVTARIPVRTNSDDRYFSDTYQGIPKYGYTCMFKNLLDHRNIKIELQVDYLTMRNLFEAKHLVFTGPIDAYFNHAYGELPYRSLEFKHKHLPDTEWLQPVGTINYPNDHPFTRVTEFKHLTGETNTGTSIVMEYPKASGDPYYPIPTTENEVLYKKYALLAKAEPNVTFVGRLSQYRYYNMDQVVGAALTAARRIADNIG